MNPVTNVMLIVSLLLALAAGGNSSKGQAEASSPSAERITTSRPGPAGPSCSGWACTSNHNETLVRDTASVQADGKSRAPKKVRAIKDINDDATKDLREIVTKVEPKAAKAKKPGIRRTRTQRKDRMKDLDSKDRLQNFEIQR